MALRALKHSTVPNMLSTGIFNAAKLCLYYINTKVFTIDTYCDFNYLNFA